MQQNISTLQGNPSLGYWGNNKVIGSLLSHVAICIPGIQLRKLIKIVYLIDEAFVSRRGFPLTWLDYYAWEKGPVAREVYDIKSGCFSEYVRCEKNAEGKNIITPKAQEDETRQQFSEAELEIVDEIIQRYKNCSADELTDITHAQGTPWYSTVTDHHIDFTACKESDQKVDMRQLAQSQGKEEIFDEAQWNMELLSAMNQPR